MSNLVLEAHRDIQPIFDIEKTDAMLRILVDMTPQQQERIWIRDTKVGSVCLFQHEQFPGVVLEYVQGSADDSVTTLYQGNPRLADMSRLHEVRSELIDEIGRALLAIPSSVVVYDAGRERQCYLSELGTAQLQDVLAHFTSSDVRAI